jgi:hypothetical protein
LKYLLLLALFVQPALAVQPKPDTAARVELLERKLAMLMAYMEEVNPGLFLPFKEIRELRVKKTPVVECE